MFKIKEVSIERTYHGVINKDIDYIYVGDANLTESLIELTNLGCTWKVGVWTGDNNPQGGMSDWPGVVSDDETTLKLYQQFLGKPVWVRVWIFHNAKEDRQP